MIKIKSPNKYKGFSKKYSPIKIAANHPTNIMVGINHMGYLRFRRSELSVWKAIIVVKYATPKSPICIKAPDKHVTIRAGSLFF